LKGWQKIQGLHLLSLKKQNMSNKTSETNANTQPAASAAPETIGQTIELPGTITEAIRVAQEASREAQSLIRGFIMGSPSCDPTATYDVSPDGKYLIKKKQNE
jgi:hypothetical protein